MNCPNCTKELFGNNICPHCGMDAALFQKTIYVSDSYYTMGLEQAKQSDLSNAVVNLTKSIEFNKNNINARNVLGLVYYEMGRIGDALKHFVISASIQKEANPANEYILSFQKSARVMEKQDEAIKMYNQALAYLHQKSDDIAQIQLKKALEINGRFIDALNLLALCHLIQNEKEKARVLIDKVLSIDVGNPIAQAYYREIGTVRVKPEVVKQTKPVAPTKPVYGGGYVAKSKGGFGSNFFISEIIFFLIGIGCAFALLYILVIPAELAKKDLEINQLKATMNTNEQSYKEAQEVSANALLAAEDENKKIKEQNESYAQQIDQLERIGKVNTVTSLYSAGSLEEAADALAVLNVAGLPADVMEKSKELMDKIYPEVSLFLYNEGTKAYNARDYDTSKVKLEKSLKFTELTANYADDIMYYLGLIAEINEDTDEAIKYFKTVVEEYSNSNQFYRARSRLANLE